VCDQNEKKAIQTKVFESAALGIPSIVPEYNLSGDFVRKYGCGVVITELKPSEIKFALERVINSNFSPNEIRSQWNWENESHKLVDTYRSYDG
jgi:glycosyltransferase involved in cell wall biosynthesis